MGSSYSGKQRYRVILKVQLSKKKASLTCLTFPELQTVHQLPKDKCLENQTIIPLPSGERPIHLPNKWSMMTHFFQTGRNFQKFRNQVGTKKEKVNFMLLPS